MRPASIFTRRLVPVVMLLVALCLGACGMVPTASDTGPGTSASPVIPPLPSVDPNVSNACLETIRRIQTTFSQLPGFTLDLVFMQKSGKNIRSGRYRITSKQSRAMRIEVTGGNGEGTKLLWEGGNTVKVRPAGLLGALVVSLDLHDDRVLSCRGYTLAQIDVASFVGMLSAPRNRVTLLGNRDGQIYLQVVGPDLLPGCVKALYAVDDRTFYPTLVDLSDSKEVVAHNQCVGFRSSNVTNLDI